MKRYHVTTNDFDNIEGFIIEIFNINEVVVGYKLYAINKSNLGDHVILIDGSLKWSGCSDVIFKNSIHFCGGLEDWIIFNESVKIMFSKAYEELDISVSNFSNGHGIDDFIQWDKIKKYNITINEYHDEINLVEDN